jgi:hypothetical protein
MYQTSTLTLQMFIGCGGINVLVEFLEEDIDAERDLVLIGVNGVWSVFELQGPTPKNDFCRILSRSSVLYPLSLVLNRVVDETGELAELIEGRIVNIFLIFSQAESHVKDLVADRMILKRKSHSLFTMKAAGTPYVRDVSSCIGSPRDRSPTDHSQASSKTSAKCRPITR